jgi:hypothetical protein
VRVSCKWRQAEQGERRGGGTSDVVVRDLFPLRSLLVPIYSAYRSEQCRTLKERYAAPASPPTTAPASSPFAASPPLASTSNLIARAGCSSPSREPRTLTMLTRAGYHLQGCRRLGGWQARLD